MSMSNPRNHPESMIRLASTTYQFPCPQIIKEGKLSFQKSFKTMGNHPYTMELIQNADDSRKILARSLSNVNSSSFKTIVTASQMYLPLIQQIILTCEDQPEMARIDEKLIFEWTSGLDKRKKSQKSEGILYDMVMSLVSQAIGLSGMARDDCTRGDFASANKAYRSAAGIMQTLEKEHVPNLQLGSASNNLTPETTIETSECLKLLFLAMGQQMAVSSVLAKHSQPNYSLLSKLTLGAAEQYELFSATFQSKISAQQQSRMDPGFLKFIEIQIPSQRALAHYFQARAIWNENEKYGIGIAMLRESLCQMKSLKVENNKWAAKALKKDVDDTTAHMTKLLKVWENENLSVYYDSVPGSVPQSRRLSRGIMMTKVEPFVIPNADPLPLM